MKIVLKITCMEGCSRQGNAGELYSIEQVEELNSLGFDHCIHW